MTSPLVSPTRFLGLPWETWTNAMGRTIPSEDSVTESKWLEKNKVGVMKLPVDDMKIFGLCPERDPFTVVVCKSCNLCMKPQALLAHFQMRHSNNERSPHECATTVPVPLKSTEKVVKNHPAKVRTKKTPNKESRNKKRVVNHVPSLPVLLTLKTSGSDPGSSKGESPLQPVVSLNRLQGTTASTAAASVLSKHCTYATPVPTSRPVLTKVCGPPHQHAPQRAVPERSELFNQLLIDHCQAKELKQKKGVDQKTYSTMAIPAPQPTPTSERKDQFLEYRCVVKPHVLVFGLPELNLNVTPNYRIYLSSTPQSLVLKTLKHLVPAPKLTTSLHSDLIAYTLNQPKPLSAPIFSSYKAGGLLYSNRRMHVLRHNLDSCINREKVIRNSMRKKAKTIELFAGHPLITLPVAKIPTTMRPVIKSCNRISFSRMRNKAYKPKKVNKLRNSNKPNTVSSLEN